jgi:YVTN family beta-propeller protein
MSVRPRRLILTAPTLAVTFVIGIAQALGQNAYIGNFGDGTVSVIDTTTNTVVATIPVGANPTGVAVTADGSRAYIASVHFGSTYGPLSVIDTTTNMVVSSYTMGPGQGVGVTPDGRKVYVALTGSCAVAIVDTVTGQVIAPLVADCYPVGIAIAPDGSKAYIAHQDTTNVSIIDTTTNAVTFFPVGGYHNGIAISADGSRIYLTDNAYKNVNSPSVSVVDAATHSLIATIPVGGGPFGIALTPDGSKAYVADYDDNTVSVIATSTNNVIATIPVGVEPQGVAFTPDGRRAYVTNLGSNNVSVIDTASNTVSGSISVGNRPYSYGFFIQPAASAGTLSSGNTCNGTFTGTFNGDITVTAGQNCSFVGSCEIAGNVTVKGGSFTSDCMADNNVTENSGSLTLNPHARVNGNLQVTGASAFTLGGAAVGGDLQIQQVSMGEPQSSVCGTQVKGNLTLNNNRSPLQIGANNPSVCAGNTIGGDLQAGSNTAALGIDYNTISGNLQINNNTATTDVSRNQVGKNLQCQNNAVITWVARNTVHGTAQGQCAASP